MSDDRNLLITIIDTNPVWWGLQAAGLVKSDTQQSTTTPVEILNFIFISIILSSFIFNPELSSPLVTT